MVYGCRKGESLCGRKIDAVFCGSDYDENSFWNVCYPDAELVIFPRDGISSTEIRKDIYGHWDWLPTNVRPYYVKKVLLIGSESTGKSTLTQILPCTSIPISWKRQGVSCLSGRVQMN